MLKPLPTLPPYKRAAKIPSLPFSLPRSVYEVVLAADTNRLRSADPAVNHAAREMTRHFLTLLEDLAFQVQSASSLLTLTRVSRHWERLQVN